MRRWDAAAVDARSAPVRVLSGVSGTAGRAGQVRQVRDGMANTNGGALSADEDPGRDVVVRLELRLTALDRTVVDEMRRRGGFLRLEDCVLAGLYLLARQLDLDVPVATFEIKGR